MSRVQMNITLSENQRQVLFDNYGKMTVKKLSELIGCRYGKTMQNIYLLGLSKPEQIKEIDFDSNGFFDVDKFKKLYEY